MASCSREALLGGGVRGHPPRKIVKNRHYIKYAYSCHLEGTWIENITCSESRIFAILDDFREILGIIWEEGGTCLNLRETPE